MRKPERQFELKIEPDDILEEGPERWVREIPVETFGTEEERGANYLRLYSNLKSKEERQGIPEKQFRERLEKVKEFFKNMPLLHMTDLKSVLEIFESGKILSTSELKKNRPEGEEFKTMTYRNDENAGLDKFIFFSTLPFDNYGDVALVIDKKILNRPDCLVTAEDIGEVQQRVGMPHQYYWDEVNLDRESLGKIQEEYRKEVISGKDFQEFFPYFLTIHHKNPEEYGRLCRKREKDGGRPWSELMTLKREKISKSEAWEPRKSPREQIVSDAKGNYYRETQELEENIYYSEQKERAKFPLSLFPQRWLAPEIKVMKEISREDIFYVIVEDQKKADLLIEKGLPVELIKVGSFWEPVIEREHV